MIRFLSIFFLSCLMIYGFTMSFSIPAYGGTITGTLYEESGDPLEGVTILGYAGPDPERYDAYPEEILKAFTARTGRNGAFSLVIPDEIPSFTLKIKVDRAVYNPIVFNNMQNKPGTISIKDPIIAIAANSETFWITSDSNAQNPNTLSLPTNRWEQLKTRGKQPPIYIREAILQDATCTEKEAREPEIRGLPRR